MSTLSSLTPPREIGDPIYAFIDGVTSYDTPSRTYPSFVTKKTQGNDGISWTQGQFIGNYTGELRVSEGYIWYKVQWVVYVKARFGSFGRKYTLTPNKSAYKAKQLENWFRGDEVSANQPMTADEAEAARKQAANDELKKLLESTLNETDTTDNTNKGFFASIFGPTSSAGNGSLATINQNAIYAIIVILVFGIGGLLIYRRNQNKK